MDRETKIALIDAIISMYHTTRLREVSAADHILSKAPVQKAFDALLARTEAATGVGEIVSATVGACQHTRWAAMATTGTMSCMSCRHMRQMTQEEFAQWNPSFEERSE